MAKPRKRGDKWVAEVYMNDPVKGKIRKQKRFDGAVRRILTGL